MLTLPEQRPVQERRRRTGAERGRRVLVLELDHEDVPDGAGRERRPDYLVVAAAVTPLACADAGAVAMLRSIAAPAMVLHNQRLIRRCMSALLSAVGDRHRMAYRSPRRWLSGEARVNIP
jgi:hypothetical protein